MTTCSAASPAAISRAAPPTAASIWSIPRIAAFHLEQPLELGGSAVELLELGEADMAGATQLKSDDDFLLTPVQEDVVPDESDSGSQVIALDSEEDLSSGAFAPASSGMVAMLEEDTGEGVRDGGHGSGRQRGGRRGIDDRAGRARSALFRVERRSAWSAAPCCC